MISTLVLAVASMAAPAAALENDPYSGFGQSTPKIAVYPYSYNSVWQPAMDAALANWNATYSPVGLTKSTLSGSSITAASYSDTWFGYYQACGSTCLYIRLNARTISASASNVSGYITSTLVHEYGHALYLGHRDGQDSIMNRSRNRNTMVRPSSSDVANVIGNYPGWQSS